MLKKYWGPTILTGEERRYLEEGFDTSKQQREAADEITRNKSLTSPAPPPGAYPSLLSQSANSGQAGDRLAKVAKTPTSDPEPKPASVRAGGLLGRAVIIDIPYKDLAQPEAPRCCRMHTDGRQCELPAVVEDQCLRHYRWHKLYQSMHGLPLPEDALSLQEMLAYSVDMVLSRRITPEERHAVANLCRIMEKNLTRCERELAEIARRR